MSWNFKTSNKISKPKNKVCNVDETVDFLKKKYTHISIEVLESIVVDTLVKHLTENKLRIEDIKEKYSNINEIEDIISDILKLNEKS